MRPFGDEALQVGHGHDRIIFGCGDPIDHPLPDQCRSRNTGRLGTLTYLLH